ncbi:MAG: TetR/AcrR family transcriptional regulator [Actinomycetota bacterium]|nr:TetR/AcrR family transcriptional regulator [Actinomycetota bacterium]
MPPTRERIVAAARQLIAQRGYRGTSVGDIEAAAGLSPRSGALYKHFPSKRAVLEAVMAQHADVVDEMRAQIAVLPLGDLRAELTLIARWGIAELRREHELTRIVMKEGDRFPELAATFRAAIVDRGHRMAAEWVESFAARRGARVQDPAAAGALLTDSLVGFTLQELLFGPAPGGVDEDRFVAAWVEGAVALVERLVEERSPAHA